MLRLRWMEPIFAAPLYYELRTAHGGLEHTDCLVRRGGGYIGPGWRGGQRPINDKYYFLSVSSLMLTYE